MSKRIPEPLPRPERMRRTAATSALLALIVFTSTVIVPAPALGFLGLVGILLTGSALVILIASGRVD
jgi:hypothetical protein